MSRLSNRVCRRTLGTSLLAVLALLLLAAPVSAAPPAPKRDFSLKQLRMGDLTARGNAATLSLYLPGYGDYELGDGSYLYLEYDHSPLLRPEDSTLTVVANGTPIGSVLLTSQNAKRTGWKISLPADRLRRDINLVELQYQMWLPDDRDCTDQENPARYSTIYANSYLHYDYASPLRFIPLPPPDLARFPEPFLRPTAPEGDVTFVLPDHPSSSDFGAAASIAARFGQLAGSKPFTAKLRLAGGLSQELRASRDLVVIGTPETNGLLRELSSRLPLKYGQGEGAPGYVDQAGQPVATDSGVLQEILSPWDGRFSVLVVSGGSEEGVSRAARTLSSRLGTAALQGAYAIVTKASEGLRQGQDTSTEGATSAVNLEQLGVRQSTVKGAGAHSISFAFDALPPDSSEGVYFDLVSSHSPVIDPSRSTVTVAVNNMPVYTMSLKADNGERSSQRIRLSGSALRPGSNSATVTFNLYPRATEGCGPDAQERAWAVLHPDSSLLVPPVTKQPPLGLSNLPYPFVQRGTLSSSLLVLPDDPTLLEDSLQAAVVLGRQSSGTSTELQASTASELTEEAKRSHNLVAYGLPENNGVIAEAAGVLPMALGVGSERTLRGPETVLLGLKDAANLGILELISSPWNADRALLVLSGSSLEMAKQSYQLLDDRLPAGNVAVVSMDDKGEPKVAALTLGTVARPAGDTQVKNRLYTVASIPALLVIVGMVGLMLARLTKQ